MICNYFGNSFGCRGAPKNLPLKLQEDYWLILLYVLMSRADLQIQSDLTVIQEIGMAATAPASPGALDNTEKAPPGTIEKPSEPTCQLQWMYQNNVKGNSGKKQQSFAFLAIPMFVEDNLQFENVINEHKDFGNLTKYKRKSGTIKNLEPFGEANKAVAFMLVALCVDCCFDRSERNQSKYGSVS